jgi:hypothetical protein
MLILKQRCAAFNLEKIFTVIVSNNYLRISGKMGFSIGDKALLLEC